MFCLDAVHTSPVLLDGYKDMYNIPHKVASVFSITGNGELKSLLEWNLNWFFFKCVLFILSAFILKLCLFSMKMEKLSMYFKVKVTVW